MSSPVRRKEHYGLVSAVSESYLLERQEDLSGGRGPHLKVICSNI